MPMNELVLFLLDLIQNITSLPPNETNKELHIAHFKDIRLHSLNPDIKICVPTYFKITNPMSLYNKFR